MDLELQTKTALVTGASRGIGRAVALRLAQAGADVALVYAGNRAAAEDAAAEIAALGRTARCYQCNVADFDAVAAMAARAEADFGGVDILVNNAGVTRDKVLLAMTEDDFDAVLDVNLKGAFNVTRHLYRQFARRKSGRIINISSVVGLAGNSGQANYAASKAGLVGFTKSIARELAARSITVNAVAPGFIESDMTDALPEAVRAATLAGIPMARYGSAAEVAELVAFLASPRAGYITGQVLCIDGGMHM